MASLQELLLTILSYFSFLKKNNDDFTRFQNITVDEIYHPRLTSISYRITTILTSINTLILPLMIYIILTKSKKLMGNYKNLIILQLSIDYIFNLVTFTFHPILFWPMLLGVSSSLFQVDTNMSYILLYFEITLLLWMAIIQLYLLFYRFLNMFKKTFLHLIYRNDKIFALSLFMALSTACVLALTPFYLIDKIDPDEVRNRSASDAPAIKSLLKKFPNMIGFYPKLSNGTIYIFVNLLAIIFFLFPLLIMAFGIILTIRLQTLHKILKPQTYSMHKMLHKATLVQLVIVTFAFVTPLAVLIILLFFEVSWGSMGTPLCISLVHLHMLFESLNLLYFIKPYRVFLFEHLFQRNIRNEIIIVKEQLKSMKLFQ